MTAIMDSGSTDNYIMASAHCNNVRPTTHPVYVKIPNGYFIKSTHVCVLDLTQLPSAASKSHLIPGLTNGSLMHVGQSHDAHCLVNFDKTKVVVTYAVTMVLEGAREHTNGMWRVQLGPSHAPRHQEINDIYAYINNRDLVHYMHAAPFIPVPSTWIKAITNGHFATWLGVTKELVALFLPKSISPVKGHMNQIRKYVRTAKSGEVPQILEK
jgi:hypothetical protein